MQGSQLTFPITGLELFGGLWKEWFDRLGEKFVKSPFPMQQIFELINQRTREHDDYSKLSDCRSELASGGWREGLAYGQRFSFKTSWNWPAA